MQLFFPCFSVNVYRVQFLSDKGRQPLGGKTQTIAQGLISGWDRGKGKGSVSVRGELVICWKQPAHSQISRIRKENLKVEMETRCEEGTEITGGWQEKSVRCQENLFCPPIL